MVDFDPQVTRRDLIPGIAEELEEAGFEDAQEVGRGGFGVVYRCRQRALDRTVAVKVLTSGLDEENLERFLREQHAMGRLSGHPNIVNVHQVGVTPTGRPYIVMPFCPLNSLETQIRREGPLEWSEAVRVGVKMAGALETAHRTGILHRDVKPGNILLTEYGEPQLTDFGIARIAGGFETTTGTVTGSPAFTAPEVLTGHTPTAASDVYSLGATLFCLMTGHAAFERRSGEKIVAQFLRITTQPVPDLRPGGIPDEVCATVERAMAENPADRFASAAEFGEELREIQRRNGLSVDEMALPIDLAAGQRDERSRGASRGTVRPRTDDRRYGVSTGVTPPVPSTRFRPPTPTRQLVTRGRLIEALRAGQRRRLVVIHAPAGFGKTTLAVQWRDVLTEEGVAVAWLTVDGDDNNVAWFLSHLIEAIRRVRPTLAEELGQELEEHGDEAERYVLTSLINEIHESGERVAVVIDDWHRVTDAATIAALDFLLDNGCHHLQVIVTSRTRAGLPMSRMRVRDELIEIDSAALRFDVPESRSFLVDLGGLELEKEDVTDLQDSTDGWVAALQLASLSLRACDDPTELIGHISGRHHAIGEFLAENVLDTLEPEMLDFLMATSITERLCGSLAKALAKVPRGQAMLEQVEDRDLFLRRLDENREWFRYHHLFAEYLQRRLERDQPERIEELHRTASRWFADHKLLSEAVDHALAAGDSERAAELVEADGTSLLEHSQMATLLGLVAKLPPRLVASRPRLQIMLAWANVLLQRSAPTLAALDRFDSTLARSSLTDDEKADLRVEAAVVKGVVEISADRIDGVDELVSECLSRPESLPPWVVSVAANVASFVEIYRFDFDAAHRWQEWAGTYHERTNGPFSVMYGHCFAGIAANEQLEVATAEDNFRKALRIARKSAGKHSHAALLAGALLGELVYEQGNVTEAERLIDESYALGSEGGVVDFMLSRYVIGSRIKVLRGDRAAAIKHLDDGARCAEALSLPRLRARVENERMRLGLTPRRGVGTRPPVEYATRWRPAGNSEHIDGVKEITAQLEEATAIRSLLTGQSPDRMDLACTWAQDWVTNLEGRGRHRAFLQANRLLVACLSTAGRTDEAKATLASMAATCAEHGMTRYLLDGGPRVISIIAALREDQRSGQGQPEWPDIPASFLDELLTLAAQAHTTQV